jgi:L-seryl-tRNA(Ser) seleniumtransferase
MSTPRSFLEAHGLKRVLNAIGMPTITGANVVAPEVRAVVDEALSVNVEIDELQRAACRVIAAATGAEAGCVTSSCSSGLAIMTAAAMTGADLWKITQLPDTNGMRDEVIMPLGHDVNFGGEISQMVRLTGARLKRVGTANHCDGFHIRGALGSRTAAVLYVVNAAVNQKGWYPTIEECAELAAEHDVPVCVDAAGEPDVRAFVRAGAALVVTSAHKMMGAPTAGMICGQKNLVRACYLQNWGIGRAMKVGKEGIAGCIAAVESWYGRDLNAERKCFARRAAILEKHVAVIRGSRLDRVDVEIPVSTHLSARQFANLLREGDPPVWVRDADDSHGSRHISLSLRVMDEADADAIGRTIADALAHPKPPLEDVPYHDLYWSEARLLRWPE